MTLLLYHIISFLSIEKRKKTLILSIFFRFFVPAFFPEKPLKTEERERPNGCAPERPAPSPPFPHTYTRTHTPAPAHMHPRPRARALLFFFFILPPLLPSASVWASFFPSASFFCLLLLSPSACALLLLSSLLFFHKLIKGGRIAPVHLFRASGAFFNAFSAIPEAVPETVPPGFILSHYKQ